jgi:hypothetical protein
MPEKIKLNVAYRVIVPNSDLFEMVVFPKRLLPNHRVMSTVGLTKGRYKIGDLVICTTFELERVTSDEE